MLKTKLLGDRGEAIARTYLAGFGYEIITANYRYRRLELDIIAKKEGRLIFSEVKTRTKSGNETNATPLTARQARNLKRAMTAYCLENGHDLDLVRLDLIVIMLDGATGLASLRHYKDVF